MSIKKFEEINFFQYINKVPQKNLILAILGSFLFFLSSPPFNLWFMAFFALIPLFIIHKNISSVKSAFFYGWIFGIMLYLLGFRFLVSTIQVFGQLPFWLSVIIFILFCLFFALKYAVFFMFAKYFTKYKMPFFLSYLAALLIVELFFPELFPFFLGNSQIENFYFIQFADVIGIKGMSLIVFCMNYMIFNWVFYKEKRMVILICSLLFAFYSYGFIRTMQISNFQENSPKLKVGIIQPDTPFLPYLNRQALIRISRNVLGLTEQLLAENKNDLDLIIWPESATPFRISQNSAFSAILRNYLSSKDNYFIFSEINLEAYQNGKALFSSATLFGPHAKYLSQYHKVYLLPFGEFMPLSSYFPALRSYFPQVGNFQSGSKRDNFKLKNYSITPQICYESLLPNFVRNFVQKGSDLIVNLTNDKWFGSGSASALHLWLLKPRAIENRLPLVRATNSGISIVLDQSGKTIAGPTPVFKKATLTAHIPIVKHIFGTYTYIGDYPLILLLLYLLYLIFQKRKKFKKALKKN